MIFELSSAIFNEHESFDKAFGSVLLRGVLRLCRRFPHLNTAHNEKFGSYYKMPPTVTKKSLSIDNSWYFYEYLGDH